MRKYFLLGLFFFISFFALATHISGVVMDENLEPLPFSVVFVKGTTWGTTANADGFFSMELKPGNYTLVAKLIGYQPNEKSFQIEQQLLFLSIKLKSTNLQLKELKIQADAEDPAYAVIRAAQRKRKYHLNQVKAYSCSVFIKGLGRITKYPPKKIAGVKVSIEGMIDSTSGIVYLSESESNYYYKYPGKVHEEMIASKTSGMKNGFSYNRASDLDFNFYKASLKNTELSERGFISPIAPNALRFYRFKLLGTFYENEELINKIKVIPKRKGDAVFSGNIYIAENSWRIHSTDLLLDKNTGIQWVDTLRVRQEYLKVNDTIWMPFKNNFEYVFGGLGARGFGNYTGVYSNYSINTELPKSVFASEAITFAPDALHKDSAYWNAKRSIPLTQEEVVDYRKRDSVEIAHNTKRYIDSVEKVKNRFRWHDVVDGYTFRREGKNLSFTFEPMYNSISFNTVQGVVINPSLRWNKKLTETKRYEIGATGGYGFSNKKYFGFGHAAYTYNSKKLSKLELSGGEDILQFNSNAVSPLINTIYTLLLEDNLMRLFDKKYVRLAHTTELFNGFIFFAATEFADRNPLRNKSKFTFINYDFKYYDSNDPLVPDNTNFAFVRNQSFHVEAAFQYTPCQRYYFMEGEKLMQDSKYPSFTIYYKKAIKNVLGSDVDLDLVKVGAEGNLNWSRFGRLHYVLEAGQFVNRTQMTFMDWKYFNGNRTLYSDFSGKQFQLLDYYNKSSNNQYAEMHLQQNFNGAFLSKIPLLKRAKIQEILSANFLVTSDKVSYTELGIGFQKLFIRMDYVIGFSKEAYLDSSFRFGFLF